EIEGSLEEVKLGRRHAHTPEVLMGGPMNISGEPRSVKDTGRVRRSELSDSRGSEIPCHKCLCSHRERALACTRPDIHLQGANERFFCVLRHSVLRRVATSSMGVC